MNRIALIHAKKVPLVQHFHLQRERDRDRGSVKESKQKAQWIVVEYIGAGNLISCRH